MYKNSKGVNELGQPDERVLVIRHYQTALEEFLLLAVSSHDWVQVGGRGRWEAGVELV